MKRYSQPIQYDNPYFQKPAKNWWMQHDRWAYGVTSLLIVGCVGYFAINQQWCWINNITVTGNEYLSTEQITQPAWQALNTRRWWLLPQRFYFFSNTNYIAEHIKQTLSNNFGLDTVIVTKQFPKQINIVVSERIPGLTYIINNDYYYLDQASYITEKVSNISEINQKYPHLRDLNTTRTVTVGNSVVGEQTMNFLVQLNKNFTKVSQLNIAEYQLPLVQCQKKSYVAEKLINEDINQTTDETLKQQKLLILEQLQKKEITVDESLALLDDLKKGNITNNNKNDNNTNVNSNNNNVNANYVAIKAQYNNTACDYNNVLHDLYVITQNNGLAVYFDTTLDINLQLTHLKTLLDSNKVNVDKLTYIDLRFLDKVYYK